jgi:hypothetical protein
MTSHGLYGPRFESQQVQEMFSFSKVRIGSGTHTASYSLDKGGFFTPEGGGRDFQSNVCFVEIQTYLTAYTSAWMRGPLQCRRCKHLNTLGQKSYVTVVSSAAGRFLHTGYSVSDVSREHRTFEKWETGRNNTTLYPTGYKGLDLFSCLFVFTGLRLTVH